MNDEYLKQARRNGSTADTKHTEAELIQTREDIKESWELLEQVRGRIFEAKRIALDEIDAKYKEELKEAEATYALLLSLAR